MARTWFESPEDSELFEGPGWSNCEVLIQTYEDALARGESPSIKDYLRVDGPERRALLLELIHVDLEFRLKRGQTARVESYFEDHSELGSDRHAALELLAAEFTLRQRHEGEVELDEYRSRFPQYFTELLERVGLGSIGTPDAEGQAPPRPARAWPAVPGYDVIAELGRGGMGVVYKAGEASLGRTVALKFLPDEYGEDPERFDRFIREARTASALNHPHICTIHALSQHAGRPFIVMEYIEGVTLKTLVGRRPGIDEVARIIGQAARALAAAHAAGVVHRDIKPDNIMVREDGYAKVLDFGLARRLPSLAEPRDGAAAATDPGRLLGTMGYMSPEQAHGSTADNASDIFSLGIVLYEVATGTHPFEADSAFGTLYAIATRHPAPAARLNPEITESLQELIEAMLQKEPKLRPTAVEVDAALSALSTSARVRSKPERPRRAVVHRDPELSALRSALESADRGNGTLVCVAGDAGIGKSTLVQDFLEEIGESGQRYLVAGGRCSERLAGAEAYAPVIDALGNLLRDDANGSIARLMKVVAPSWYVQLAAGSGADETTRASSQQALLREFLHFVKDASRLGLVVLFFDDVHWADVSTVDLLSYLGRDSENLRALVVVTYRPTELLLGPHPFHRVKLELQAKGVCTELSLGFLHQRDIEQYLADAYPGHRFPPDFASLIYSRTEGRPLFMTESLCYLQARGVIAQVDEGWSLVKELPDVWQELPESVRGMIRRKLERLGEGDRRLLAAASVQGNEFESAVIADVLDMDAAEVEERLDFLEHVHVLVRLVREHELPDGTLALRYGFVHVLYQNALSTSLRPTRRIQWSAATARALLRHHRQNGTPVATQLAVLFEASRDPARAIEYFLLAARNAAGIFAHQEAAALARRGLALLSKLPDDATRDQEELKLLLSLGVSLVSTQGFASPEVERTYARARDLCQPRNDIVALFPVLYGLWNVYLVRCELRRCEELAMLMFARAQTQSDPVFALIAHNVRQQPLFHMGELSAARHYQEQGLALYDPHAHRDLTALYGEDSGVGCLAYGVATLWQLGYPEQAMNSVRAARDLAEEIGDPFNVAQALYFGAFTYLCCREMQVAKELAEKLIAVCTEHGFALLLAGGMILRGRCLAEQGQMDEGIRQMQRGLADWQKTGAVSHRPFQLALLAEVLGNNGNPEAALTALTEALTICTATGERFWEAELNRLKGEVLASHAGREANAVSAAEACFRQALGIAQRQKAKSLELRALMSLSRLCKNHDRPDDARPLLAEVYGWFTEGLDTRDLLETKALLEGSPR